MKLFYTQDYIQNIGGEDRFKYPESIFRVTAGIGSDVLLYIGSEKTALIDCGTAYSSKILIENIEETLSIMSKKNNKRYSLDYILLTHTHYDHVGALSDIKINWPSAIVFGNKQAYNLLKKDNVFDLISKLNNDVSIEYTGEKLVTPLEKSAMQIEANYFVFPHYGIIYDRYKEDVFDLVLEQMHEKKEIVLNNYKLGNSWEDIVKIYVNKYWKQLNSKDILYDIFYSNCKSEIKAILRDYNISDVVI